MNKYRMSLRELYRTLEAPGASPFKDAQQRLDGAVRDAYGISKTQDALSFLLELNRDVCEKELIGDSVTGPGLPEVALKTRKAFVSDDAVNVARVTETVK